MYPQRKRMRLRGYNYSYPGAYFITVCTQGRICRFGEVINGSMVLNDAGRMVDRAWTSLAAFVGVELDEHVVMPNHLHGILILTGSDTKEVAVSRLVGRFKSTTTVKYIDGIYNLSWPEFYSRLWQRGYYERIIRNEAQLTKVREYIRNNPAKWELDAENPEIAHSSGRHEAGPYNQIQ